MKQKENIRLIKMLSEFNCYWNNLFYENKEKINKKCSMCFSKKKKKMTYCLLNAVSLKWKYLIKR